MRGSPGHQQGLNDFSYGIAERLCVHVQPVLLALASLALAAQFVHAHTSRGEQTLNMRVSRLRAVR